MQGVQRGAPKPANPTTHSPCSSDFDNLLPRPFVCRKRALRGGNELTEAHLEVPELGFPRSSGLTFIWWVASKSPPWDRQVEISFPSPASCENIIKHPWRSLPLLTRGKKKYIYKPQSLITHHKHETLQVIAQGGAMPQRVDCIPAQTAGAFLLLGASCAAETRALASPGQFLLCPSLHGRCGGASVPCRGGTPPGRPPSPAGCSSTASAVA